MAVMREVLREGRAPEMPRRTEGELPESKIFDLLSSVGNGEHHALDLIVMREGIIYSTNALDKEMINRQGENPAWRIGWGVPFSHCRQSLAPIGLVTKEALRPDGSAWGYQITEFGLHTGVPFAGILLKWSYEHPEHSLYKIWGATNSASIKDEQSLEKKRAQETRYKILWELATNPSNRIRLKDIAEAIHEKNYGFTNHHLVSISKNGVISYETLDKGKSYSYFRRKEIIPDEEIKPYETSKTLSTRIYDLLTQAVEQRANEYLSVGEITNILVQEYHEYEGLNRRAFTQRIPKILSHFEKQGYSEREKFDYTFHSEVTVSDEQREAITSLVTLIDKFKNGDRERLEMGRRFAQGVQTDPNLFSKLMLKAKEASPFANRTNRKDMESYLISILYEHPNSTIKQIQQALEKDYNKPLTDGPMRRILSALVGQEKVTSEKTKAGNVYRVADADKETVPSQN